MNRCLIISLILASLSGNLSFIHKSLSSTRSYEKLTTPITQKPDLLSPPKSSALATSSVAIDTEALTGSIEKLEWRPEGYNFWEWQGNRIHYVKSVSDSAKTKPPMILIHGFGASVFHWRYNIPELAKDFDVWAVDLLGFGLSEKPILDYSAELWRDQVTDFIKEIVLPGRTDGEKVVVAGNSLGGYTALSVAAAGKDIVSGAALLNAAGRFDDPDAPPASTETDANQEPSITDKIATALSNALQRAIITASFYITKQPIRVKSILSQVYGDPTNVDDELVESILFPAQDPNAPEVFYRVIVKNGAGPPVTVNTLLSQLEVPLLLLWGDKDPWIKPAACGRIAALYPAPMSKVVMLDAGHCPHDEVPQQVNAELKAWAQAL